MTGEAKNERACSRDGNCVSSFSLVAACYEYFFFRILLNIKIFNFLHVLVFLLEISLRFIFPAQCFSQSRLVKWGFFMTYCLSIVIASFC
jgi:hypothetical protein